MGMGLPCDGIGVAMLIAGAIAGALSKATGQEQIHCNRNKLSA